MRFSPGSAGFLVGLLFVLLGLTIRFGCGSKVNQEHVADMESNYEVVYPERLDKKRTRRDIEDDEHVMYKIHAFGKTLVLDIQKNKLMVPQGFIVRSFDDQGKEILEKSAVKNCQYQGHVQGEPDSMVVLDTCDGLRGIIDDNKEELSIEPLKSKGLNAHKLSRTKKYGKLEPDFNCGVKSHKPEWEKDGKYESNDRPRRSLAIDPLFRSHIKVSKTRYTELIMVIDHTVYKKYNRNKTEVQRRVLTLVNAVDMVYQKINIRIILKSIEIWTNRDLVPFNRKAGPDLEGFQKYKESHKQKYKSDVIHLMRGTMWDDHGGMAYMTEMCKIKSTGVVGWNYWSPLGPWLAFAHEMGHNFGFDHDADRKYCKCLTPRGCIMGTFKTRVPGFSDCNLKDLQNIDDSCLYNIPGKVNNPRCGNGIKEGNEQCDCGTSENCRLVDPCCDPTTCKLYPSSQCSTRHHRCCKNCQIAPAGTICRTAKEECDVPETCNGVSFKCPSNDHKKNGARCHYNDMIIEGNKKDPQIKTTVLPRLITARYLRINPIQWNKDICMRTELYGCNKPASPHSVTPIRSSNNLCVEAKEGICDKIDKSELRFVQSDCKHRNKQFRLTKNGVLIHQCTGNRVCPEKAVVTWGTKLVVNRRCTIGASKFKRVDMVPGKALQHIQSGLCVHPSGGLAQDGVNLVLWQGCNKHRLFFSNQDCQLPLGMENANIPNNHITASSARKDKDPMHARLRGFNSWCANTLNQKQYLQIDLGKVKRITAIATEGTFDGRRVKGYRLLHSNNGQRWTAYTRNKIPQKNSCCSKGKCAPIKSKSLACLKGVPDIFCPKSNGIVCAGNGICTSRRKCHCKKGFDPNTNCASALTVRDGVWGAWSKWSKCSRVCDGGITQRHRFCSNPASSHGGKQCVGKRIEKRACNTKKCPVAHSCRHLQAIGKTQGINYPSDVYAINPDNQGEVKTYCDMSRDGGGWTLLVTSHTNTWTAGNVRRRSDDKPKLNDDFSILYKADVIKDSVKVQGSSFQYRIEAQEYGRWGGIWQAPRSYSFVATNKQQTNIRLEKKFDNWIYEDFGIEERMPWIHGAMLTTSHNATKYAFGSIAADIKRYYPAPWINNKDQEQHPTNIWYWMREGPIKLPSSCMELQLMGLENKPLTSGVHDIWPRADKRLKAYCDFTSEGGGWTLLVTSSSRIGWSTVVKKNSDTPSLTTDYSILWNSGYIIKKKDFQYKIEDGKASWGGIFEASSQVRPLILNQNHRPRLLKKFGKWDEKTSNLAKILPYVKGRNLLTTSTTPGDASGTLVPLQNGGPSLVRLWVREGTWRSCNEIKIRAPQQSPKLRHKFIDGIYMIKSTSYQYLPVVCDMTSDPGAWTLLVTSAKNGWQKDQVKHRNVERPSLSRDYSILELGDQIKSLSGGKTFKYKLEAKSRGRWGGIWEAPIKYSFVATSNKQTNIKLLKKFDQWTYNWANSIEKRMPWLGVKSGLLTTSSHSSYSEYGSIVHEQKRNNPAPWISSGGMTNPGVIWYWINEDDCDVQRLPVHGGASSWSPWSQCTPMCRSTPGERTRTTTCTNPAPRCGGRLCNQNTLAVQKQHCIYCPKSPIRSKDNLCIQPSTKDCNPPDGTQLVYTQDLNTNCNKKHMYFIYGKDGTLVHKCSGKKVCPQAKNPGSPIILSSQCATNNAKFEQTPEKGLKHLESGLCVHPNQGYPKEGINLITYYGCKADKNNPRKLLLELFQLGKTGKIRVITPKSKPKSKPKQVRLLKKTRTSRVSPIRSHGGFCLQPKTSNCSPSNGTELVYHGKGGKNVQCNKKHMKFTLTKDGILKHTCSNMYVCPEPDFYDIGGSLWNGIPVVLKQHGCHPHKVHYTRTSAKTLRFKNSHFCVHPLSGQPTSGTTAVFWKECNIARIALDFYELN